MTVRAGRGRLTHLFFGVLLVFGGLVVGLVLSEAAYRVARHFVCIGGWPGATAVPRSFGWTHRPGAAGWAYACYQRRFEWQTYVEINSHGLREREVEYPKPAGVRRVLLLGDSMTEAIQVPAERTFARLLEQDLRASGEPVQVINAGHAGYGTDNELLFYRDEGRRYDPDLVVQVLNLQNDILENYPPLYRRAYERAGVQWPPKPWFSLGDDAALLQHPAPPQSAPAIAAGGAVENVWWWLASTFFVLRSVERLVDAPPTPDTALRHPVNFEMYAPWTESWEDAWNLTARLTEELRAAVERDGHRFAVVVVPPKETTVGRMAFGINLATLGLDARDYDLERPHRRVIDFLRAEAIPYVDLSPVLEAFAATGVPPFFTWDIHLNEHGHAAVAPAIAAFVRSRLAAP